MVTSFLRAFGRLERIERVIFIVAVQYISRVCKQVEDDGNSDLGDIAGFSAFISNTQPD